jgi:hypothetical protein
MKAIVILITVYLAIENSLSIGLGNGHNFGAALCGITDPTVDPRFHATHGNTPYGDLSDIYRYINWFLLFFIAGKLIKKEFLSQIISLSAIVLAFWKFVQVYNLKNNYLFNENKYFELMQVTLQTDFLQLLIVFVLLIYQVISAIKYCLEWKQSKYATFKAVS